MRKDRIKPVRELEEDFEDDQCLEESIDALAGFVET
jgi:hypothetical protein